MLSLFVNRKYMYIEKLLVLKIKLNYYIFIIFNYLIIWGLFDIYKMINDLNLIVNKVVNILFRWIIEMKSWIWFWGYKI